MYIIITPAKNEEENLPKVAKALISQTVPPNLWVIINDGSTDSTPKIIKDLEERYNWIKSLSMPNHQWDITYHLSYVYKMGVECAIQECLSKDVHYDFIGILDADTILEESYYEKLIIEFRRNCQLGVASGHIIDMPNMEINWSKFKNNEFDTSIPRGSGRVYRKECYLETGGYQIEPSADSILYVKSYLNGWESKQFGRIRAIQLRETSCAKGLWKGYLIRGSTAYYFDYHPLLVLMNSMDIIIHGKLYTVIPYLSGYLSQWIKRAPKINDSQIRNYYRYEKLRLYFKGKLL